MTLGYAELAELNPAESVWMGAPRGTRIGPVDEWGYRPLYDIRDQLIGYWHDDSQTIVSPQGHDLYRKKYHEAAIEMEKSIINGKKIRLLDDFTDYTPLDTPRDMTFLKNLCVRDYPFYHVISTDPEPVGPIPKGDFRYNHPIDPPMIKYKDHYVGGSTLDFNDFKPAPLTLMRGIERIEPMTCKCEQPKISVNENEETLIDVTATVSISIVNRMPTNPDEYASDVDVLAEFNNGRDRVVRNVRKAVLNGIQAYIRDYSPSSDIVITGISVEVIEV